MKPFSLEFQLNSFIGTVVPFSNDTCRLFVMTTTATLMFTRKEFKINSPANTRMQTIYRLGKNGEGDKTFSAAACIFRILPYADVDGVFFFFFFLWKFH